LIFMRKIVVAFFPFCDYNYYIDREIYDEATN